MYGGNANPDQQTSYINRAFQGLYPPGSVVKPFIVIEALQQGLIKLEDTIHDPVTIVGNQKFRDWYRKGQGKVNLKKAIAVSSDTYFYKLAEYIGIDAISEGLSNFSLGNLLALMLSMKPKGWCQHLNGKSLR